jgi:hypothetical protein
MRSKKKTEKDLNDNYIQTNPLNPLIDFLFKNKGQTIKDVSIDSSRNCSTLGYCSPWEVTLKLEMTNGNNIDCSVQKLTPLVVELIPVRYTLQTNDKNEIIKKSNIGRRVVILGDINCECLKIFGIKGRKGTIIKDYGDGKYDINIDGLGGAVSSVHTFYKFYDEKSNIGRRVVMLKDIDIGNYNMLATKGKKGKIICEDDYGEYWIKVDNMDITFKGKQTGNFVYEDEINKDLGRRVVITTDRFRIDDSDFWDIKGCIGKIIKIICDDRYLIKLENSKAEYYCKLDEFVFFKGVVQSYLSSIKSCITS